jgi:hypothetical protein
MPCHPAPQDTDGDRDDETDRKGSVGDRLDRRGGRLVAMRLGEAGAHVLVHGRDRKRGEDIVAAIAGRNRGIPRSRPIVAG